MVTQTEKIVSEEQEKRFYDLNSKPETDRTPEEKTELQGLKDNYSKTAKSRIDELSSKGKIAEQAKLDAITRAEKAEAEAKELREAQEATPKLKPQVKEETVKIGEKDWHTDSALQSQITAGQITEAEAVSYQQKRNKEEIKVEIRADIKADNKQKTDTDIRIADAAVVMKAYPQFDPKHPDHNPEDPLFKIANELYKEGLSANSRGLSLAIKRGKQILNITDTHLDRSDDLSVEDRTAPDEKGGKKGKEVEVTLTEPEEDMAIRQFTRGDAPNPKTGRAYTKAEALAAALEAKKERKR